MQLQQLRSHYRLLRLVRTQIVCQSRQCQSQSVKTPATERQAALRAEFWRREEVWETRVDYSKLSEKEKLIHEKHNEAVKNLHFTYDDPDTGLKVITRLRHFLKGSCCGSACRHCVYDHDNVDDKIKSRRLFNTAFWIDDPDHVESEDEEGQFW